ncbi:MAG: phosphohistidine phosphatase SixA [Gammaproteobacteria bacterium]
MKLYLVQHGEALAKDVDPDRPLSPGGEKDVRNMAGFLQAAGVGVDRVLHSGKLRARQSAAILAEALLIHGDAEAIDGLGPNDPVEDFSIEVHKFKQDTMVVGHLPFMARMVSRLVNGQGEPAIVDYKPGSVVCLEQDGEEHWCIQWMLRPDLLAG